jgi:phosphate starvation-inducible PhoH-like protein
LTEVTILIENVSPTRFFGNDNSNFTLLKNSYPKLKLSARGNEIKGSGSAEDLVEFKAAILAILQQLEAHASLNAADVGEMLQGAEQGTIPKRNTLNLSDVLVHGPKGKMVRARTANQKELVEASLKHDVVMAVGPAGTGKTYTAVAIAVKALKDKEVRKIILARPAVEAGESLGFLPGDLKEKIDPYVKPLYDALKDMIPNDKYLKFIENETIEIIPLAFMRGRTLDNCYVILDEAQNATDTQLKMFLTRMGPNAKVIITGDLSQIDLPRNQQSGLQKAINILGNVKGIEVVFLDTTDVVRHRLVKEIIKAYDAS